MEQSFKQDSHFLKEERYKIFIPQLRTLLEGESDWISILANTSAALKEAFDFFWVGFYIVRNTNQAQSELVLGPFQGSVACFRIRKGRGVCGTAWEQKVTQVVPDVDQFPGHIACSSLSRSEIVVPILKGEEVLGVLDIDSDELNTFDETDKVYLEQVCEFLASLVK